MLRKRLLLEVHGLTSWVDTMRYLSESCVPSLFRTLHSDADFVASICTSRFSSGFLMEYLALVPACGVSMQALLCAVGNSEDMMFCSQLNHIHRLQDLCSVIDRATPDHVVLDSEELDVLKLMVEELLSRLGMYASSLPVDEYNGGRFIATAHSIFMAIPCGVVRAQHVMITANAYSAGSREWCFMMRKVARILSHTQHHCDTGLYQAWLDQWTRWHIARGHA